MKKIIFLILLTIIIINVININETEALIPNESIRLRVIPNSNDPIDIYIKNQVKKSLEKDLYKLLKNVNDIDIARNIINNNIPNIKNNINNIFKDNNYTLSYDINFGNNYFPEKEYKGKIYEEGNYESLVISIGEASGDNWWCVIFPNYCLIDTNKKDTEYKSLIEEFINKLF